MEYTECPKRHWCTTRHTGISSNDLSLDYVNYSYYIKIKVSVFTSTYGQNKHNSKSKEKIKYKI